MVAGMRDAVALSWQLAFRALVLLLWTTSTATLVGCDAAPPAADAGPDAPPAACSADGDCDDGLFCTGIESCVGGVCRATPPPCEAEQICVEAAERCLTECAVTEDADGDGSRAMECGGLDCDDADPDRAPGNAEICDTAMHDEDCDPLTFGVRDADADGHGDARCCNVDEVSLALRCGDDCDDARSGVHPALPEVCNLVDDDCDTAIDEGLLVHVFVDADGDGHGELGTTDERDACAVEPGWARVADDCDDADAARFPGNPEVCDDLVVDEDCSGTGNDVPGGCTCTGMATESCGTTGRCIGATHQCTGGRWSPCTIVPTTEVCAGDRVDEDCDGMVDEGLTVSCYRDTDDDGYAPDGSVATPQCRSSAPGRADAPWNGCPMGFTGRPVGAGAVDCCDSDARAFPGAGAQTTARACGGFDFDCDGAVTPTIAGAMHTCAAYPDSASCNADRTNSGWCTASPPACGATAGFDTGCWWGAACQSISCWPTQMPCR